MAISRVLFIGLLCLACGGFIFPVTEAIWITVPNTGMKCVHEEIQANVVVIADFLCIEEDNIRVGPTVDIRVRSPHDNELYKETNVTNGRFAFTTSESGTYIACLWMHQDQTHHTFNGSTIVNIHWKIGISAIDWDSVAKKEKIEASP
ncbi:unnamed protein product [Cochlearia groenlandica]